MSSEVSEQKLEEKKVDVKFKSTVYCMLNRISLRSTPNKKNFKGLVYKMTFDHELDLTDCNLNWTSIGS